MRNVLRNVSTLTTLACQRLKRGSLGDPTHPGLRIMVHPSGAKVWIYRFRDPAGKMAQLLIGSLPALSLADARSMNRLDVDIADPTARIPTIPQGKRRRALSDPEIGRLLRWLDSGAVSRTIVDVLRLTLYTGARSGEVCAMRSRDVDLAAKTWTHTQGKTGDVSVTPLSAPAVEILRNRLGEECVFPVRGNPVNQKALSVALFASRQAGDACPIDHWTSHDLRRTTRTGLARLGCPFEIGESILGHRLPGVAGVYNVYAYADEMRKWLDRWAEHVAEIAAPRAKPARARPRER